MSDYQYHPVQLAADTTDLQAGTLTRVAEAVRLGIPSAAISGGLSIYNTVMDYTGGDQANIENTIRGYDEQAGDYYKENQSAVDITGFVGGAILTGGATSFGIKMLQVARAGGSVGAMARVAGYTSGKRAQYLEQALKETAESGGTIKSILDVTRRKELLWATADQAMVATAGELAIAGLMNDSPVFEGDTIGDFGWNIALGTAIGGGIGGVLSGVASKGILKEAQAGIQAQMRFADTVFDYKKLGLTKGSELMLTSESIMKLVDDLPDMKFKYNLDGSAKELDLPTSGAVKAAAERATKAATQDLQISFNELAGGNANIGQAYFEFMQEAVKAAKAAGQGPDDILQSIHGWLANVKNIDSLNLDSIALDAKKFYVNLSPAGSTDFEKLTDIFSPKRTATAKQAYRLAEGVEQSAVNIKRLDDLGEVSLRQAYRTNPDVDIVQMPNGSMRVNPESLRLQKVSENPHEYKQFIDLESGSMSSEAVPHFGDLINKAGVTFMKDAVGAGGQTFRQAAKVATSSLDTPLEASARWAWASNLEPAAILRIVGNSVDMNDLPVLARLVELQPQIAKDTLVKLKYIDGDAVKSFDDMVSLSSALEAKRYELLQERLTKVGDEMLPVPDTRVLAAQLNTDRQWVEEAIGRNFKPPVGTEQLHGKMLSTAEALKPKTVQATWDFGVSPTMLPEEAYRMNMGPQHLVTQALTAHYQEVVRQQVGRNAANAALEADAANFWEADRHLSRSSSIEGAGATLFGASNADYGAKAKLWVQDTGKAVALASQKWRDRAVMTLSPHVNAIRQSPKAAGELGILTTALRKSEHRYIQTGQELFSQDAVAYARANKLTLQAAIKELDIQSPSRSPRNFSIKNKEVSDFLETSTGLNATRQAKMTTLLNATGLTRKIDPAVVYVPPINTVKYPFHAFVRSKEKIGLAQDVSMITAKSADELRQLAAKVSDDFDVVFKDESSKYFKAKGEYEYDMTVHESKVNSEMVRRGVLADFFPETNAQNVLTDWLEMQAKGEEKVIRTAVQVGNRKFFSEMEFLSKQYRQVDESTASGLGSRAKAKIADPFNDYIKTALNISKQQEFPLLDSLNDFIDMLGIKAGMAYDKAFKQAADPKSGFTWQDANAVMKDYGMKGMYPDTAAYELANSTYPRNLIRETAQKANMFLATTLLRLDFANSLVNIISTPIMLGTEMQSIKTMIGKDSALAGKLSELTSLPVPGRGGARMPSTTKLIGESISDFFGPNKHSLIMRYEDIGAMKQVSQLYHSMLDDISFDPVVNPKVWKDKVDAVVERAAKITGNTFAEDFTRFVSANVMKKLSDPLVDAGKLSIKEQNAYISTFVNRVQGNYTTSQRPIAFQGTTGAAISLFQTYAFNVLQQLHRHTQAGDKKALAIFGGLQGTIFGLNGLPFFDAVNTHLIGTLVSNNPQHKDAYSVLPQMNEEVGNWMLYGTASALPLFSGNSPALFTRGDINPRHISILPTNPLDVPAVAASLKLFDTVTAMGKQIKDGADIGDSLLKGMEHQGLNRPLAGFAQLLAGQSTTNSGALVSAASDMQTTSWLGSVAERVSNYGGISRMMGARPMDEAVALNHLYRNKTYEAVDRARVERLGQVVKTKLYGNQVPTNEELDDFMLRYTRAGGDVKNFSQALHRWSKDADVSIINQTMQRTNSNYGKTLKHLMGGQEVPDYRNRAVVDLESQQ